MISYCYGGSSVCHRHSSHGVLMMIFHVDGLLFVHSAGNEDACDVYPDHDDNRFHLNGRCHLAHLGPVSGNDCSSKMKKSH